LPRQLQAAGATVVDTGGGLFYFSSLYEGTCHNVQTPRGRITISCHLELTSGPGVSEETDFWYIGFNYFDEEFDIPCDAVLTPSGIANVTCHN
jgi:hypothetical protein